MRRRGTACALGANGSSAAAHDYRAALARLLRGEGTHPKYVGRAVRITPAAVAREARRSRNPLYTTHRQILKELHAAVDLPTATRSLGTRVRELESECRKLRADSRRLICEQQALATQNLQLLHRAQTAEARLAVRRVK